MSLFPFTIYHIQDFPVKCVFTFPHTYFYFLVFLSASFCIVLSCYCKIKEHWWDFVIHLTCLHQVIKKVLIYLFMIWKYIIKWLIIYEMWLMSFYKQIINDCKWFKKIGDKLEIYIFAHTCYIQLQWIYKVFLKKLWQNLKHLYFFYSFNIHFLDYYIYIIIV